MPLAIRQQNGK